MFDCYDVSEVRDLSSGRSIVEDIAAVPWAIQDETKILTEAILAPSSPSIDVIDRNIS